MKYFIFLVYFLILISCQPTQTEQKEKRDTNLQNDNIEYAKGFTIKSNVNYTVATILGYKQDTTTSYVLYKNDAPVLNLSHTVYYIKVPCKKIASLSSIYSSMLCDLGVATSIKAIDNIDYYNNTTILNLHQSKQLKELSKGPELDIEQTLTLMPDIIFAFGMVNETPAYNKWLTQKNIPLVLSFDHLETNALARAEWIKFFALFVDKYQTADSIFDNTKANYQHLKQLAGKETKKPKVLSELKYGDVWYVPAGKSSVSQMIADAGGNYLWKNDIASGSLHLSFESVYQTAKDADVWINTTTANSLNDVIQQDKRYEAFKAFKTKQIYNYTKTINSKGYSSYWESAMIYPDRILNDLILIFHPQLKDSLQPFYYYKKLE
jgi:iron complex transport system substrate-binding protein